MYKIIHLHTDPKFFYLSNSYQDKEFENVVIYLGEINDTIHDKLNSLKMKFKIYPKTEQSIVEISREYQRFNGAVIYDLCDFKQQFLNKFPKSFKFFWLFFGYEIYGQIPKKFLCKETFKNAYPINLSVYDFKNYITRKISRIRNKEFGIDEIKEMDFYSRIDAILIHSKQEYEELSNFIKLPNFIKRNLNEKVVFKTHQKEPKIILGNSKSHWNNHLEALSIIDSVKKSNITFYMFFSYGKEGFYSDKVRKTALKNDNIRIIEDFLDFKEFESIYKDSAALIINSYRQHALGNIYTAIFNGCKIYLNTKSSTYRWLTSEGFNISSIESLKYDLEKDLIFLNYEEQLNNFNKYIQLQRDYTKEDFLNNIKETLDS
ncbi:TDP-N-acetylfucosamine:lipid II N-acetylfucosaminyltransferase [Brumimicrobium aurantiacum]|uniref:4-alpha-L-fucosyltransferase n=1 Tax=Brumimicrobium aurantiacum TaxID=1737063 RepID=A0A3E1F1Q3_9FLAO|nr:TDP-N-acetylfucosamine:lipid II N-acetylfucosaminyltransferase [Brumimicrobium aurantiacum]RFC55744.1 hypothetical protein DXU93_02065 [Brumimicrobium aurantiacum]